MGMSLLHVHLYWCHHTNAVVPITLSDGLIFSYDFRSTYDNLKSQIASSTDGNSLTISEPWKRQPSKVHVQSATVQK